MELTGIFQQIEEKKFTDSHCFLCGIELNKNNQTKEHVIPKWIQKEFNLRNQEVTLLNGRSLFYRHLTIPCCFNCNNKHLEPFENKVHIAFQKGFESFSELNSEIIFLWLGKIFYGLMYKELFLSMDQKDPNSPKIISPYYVDSFYSHLLFLQGIRDKHRFRNFFPASIYLFKTQKAAKVEEQWDFIDGHNPLFIALRMGEISVISVLQDGQATQQLEEHLARYKTIYLHPIQFQELSAEIFYKAVLMNRTPKYINHQINGMVETHQLPLQGMSTKPIFDEWNNNNYAEILSKFMKLPIEEVQPEPGKVWTWLRDANGNPLFIDVRE